MASITKQLTGVVVYARNAQKCTLSVDCQEIFCITTDSDGNYVFFELILLPCLLQPAVRIVLSTQDIYYDHTFHQSEEDDLHSLFTSGSIDVRLDHSPNNNSIGLQVRCSV